MSPDKLHGNETDDLLAENPKQTEQLSRRGFARMLGGGYAFGSLAHFTETSAQARDGYTRLPDQKELEQLVAAGRLVRLPENDSIEIDSRIPPDRRYCQPWAVTVLLRVCPNFRTQFNKKIRIISGARILIDDLRGPDNKASTMLLDPLSGAIKIFWENMAEQETTWMSVKLFEFGIQTRKDAHHVLTLTKAGHK